MSDSPEVYTETVGAPVCIEYRNHRNEVAWRRVLPLRIWYGESPWHHGKQWFLKAHDLDKNAQRDFALVDVLTWGNHV